MRTPAALYVIKLRAVRQAPLLWKGERTCPCHVWWLFGAEDAEERSSLGTPEEDFATKRYAPEFMIRAAVFQLAIESLPLEIRFSYQERSLHGLRLPRLQAPQLGLE